MIWFKSCPKCSSGDLEEKSDQDVHYLRCVQCGEYIESENPEVNDVFKWTELISASAGPIRFSIQDALNVYKARAARSFGTETELMQEVLKQRN